MTAPVLRVRDLRTTFTARDGTVSHAVDGVSFDLAPGETLGLVGESGCGKTVTALSLLRLISEPPGRIAPESAVEVDGVDVLRLAPDGLRAVRGARIGMVFQHPGASLNPVLSVGTQLVEAVGAHRTVPRDAARRRAVELLESVGLPEPLAHLRAYPHELSGGMQQRVMIAMALAGDPAVLVADEPTTALDVTVQARILDRLRRLRAERGMALLLISHDLAVVAGLADRIAVMYGGKIVEIDRAETILTRPAHPYTRALLDAAPRLDAPVPRLRAVGGTVPRAAAWPTGCRFHPRCAQAWDRCRAEAPPLRDTDAGAARCWLVDEPAVNA